MRVDLTGVAKGRRDEALPATALTYRSGRATLAVAETQQRPTHRRTLRDLQPSLIG